MIQLTYSPLGKAFEKQSKTIEDQGEKQIKAIKIIKNKLKKQEKQLDVYDNTAIDNFLISKKRDIFDNLIKKTRNNTKIA